jgi:hypothetical protein
VTNFGGFISYHLRVLRATFAIESGGPDLLNRSRCGDPSVRTINPEPFRTNRDELLLFVFGTAQSGP